MKRKYNSIIILGTLIAILLLLLVSPKENLDDSKLPQIQSEESQNDSNSTESGNAAEKRNLNQTLSPKPFDPETFNKKYPGNWNMTYTEQGTIQSLSGGVIALESLSTQTLLDVARDMAPLFGVPADQLSESVVEPSETASGKNFKISQTYQGLPVYDSSLFYYVSKKDTSLRIIDNSLKIIDEASLKKKYNAEEALDIVLRSYPGFKRLESQPIESFIYVVNQKGEWVYRIIITHTNDDREILISAISAEILLDQSLVIE